MDMQALCDAAYIYPSDGAAFPMLMVVSCSSGPWKLEGSVAIVHEPLEPPADSLLVHFLDVSVPVFVFLGPSTQ